MVVTYAVDFTPVDWGTQITMPQHSKPQKRQSHALREEYTANVCGDPSKGIPNTSYHNILKDRCLLDERGLISFSSKKPFEKKLER